LSKVVKAVADLLNVSHLPDELMASDRTALLSAEAVEVDERRFLPFLFACLQQMDWRDIPESFSSTLGELAVSAYYLDGKTSLSLDTRERAIRNATYLLALSGRSARASALASKRSPTGESPESGEAGRTVALLRSICGALVSSDLQRVGYAVERLGKVESDEPLGQLAAHYIADCLREAYQDMVDSNRASPSNISDERWDLGLRLALMAGDPECYDAILWCVRLMRAYHRRGFLPVLRRLAPGIVQKFSGGLAGSLLAKPLVELWPSQQTALEEGLLSNKRTMLCMPTNAGKTVPALLAACNHLSEHPKDLVCYVVPTNALARQVGVAAKRFLETADLGEVTVWTGAYELDEAQKHVGALLVTTPEKLDSIVRGNLTDRAVVKNVCSRLSLLIVDELQSVGNGGRGTVLELLVARLLIVRPELRIIGIAPPLKNGSELGAWLGEGTDCKVETKWEPIRRDIVVYQKSGTVRTNDGQPVTVWPSWAQALTGASTAASELVRVGRHPVLVIETSQAWAEQVIEDLLELGFPAETTTELEEVALLADSELGFESKLGSALRKGLAYHHAGLSVELRSGIESLCERERIKILSSTTTLAEGVDLPFKSLVLPHYYFRQEMMKRYLVQNIVGRVGRVAAGGRGIAVLLDANQPAVRRSILTQMNKVASVRSSLRNLVQQPTVVSQWQTLLASESQLLGFLLDNANSTGAAEPVQLLENSLIYRDKDAGAVRTQRVGNELERRLRSMLRHGFVSRNSPYALTNLGKVAALTGLSAVSCRIVYRQLEELCLGEATWFASGAWRGEELQDGLLRIGAQLVTLPIEAVRHFVARSPKKRNREDDPMYGEDGIIINYAKAGELTDAWDKISKSAMQLIEAWLLGLDLASVSIDGSLASGFGDVGSHERIMATNEFVFESVDFYRWMMTAVVRLSEQVAQEREVKGLAFRRVLTCMRYGTPSLTANRLAALGLDRVVATKAKSVALKWRDLDDAELLERLRRVYDEDPARLLLSEDDLQIFGSWISKSQMRDG
jgi:replicative superfamily II helicase